MRYSILLLSILFLLMACKDPFLPGVIADSTGYLVVEGFINADKHTPTSIRLTHSGKVNDKARLIPEMHAIVNIEIKDGMTTGLIEKDSGYYATSALNLDGGQLCRLYIKTVSGKEYRSDYIPVKKVPEIDSINWKVKNDGCEIYVTTHDNNNQTWYYFWEYEATWEQHPASTTNVKYDRQNKVLVYRDFKDRDSLYRCWQQEASSSILLATSDKLGEDIIYQYPIVFIPPADIKLSVLYSILVKQYALTAEAYHYRQNVKKITEELGTIFSPLPAEVGGNIHCITNPDEPVIGFITASTVTVKRQFVTVPNWKYYISCTSNSIGSPGPGQQLSPYWEYLLDTASLCPPPPPLSPGEPCKAKYGMCCPPAIPTELIADERGRYTLTYVYDTACIDCLLSGKGTRQKPDYWPR